MYNVHIEVESLVYIYVYVGSKTIFFPVEYSRMMIISWRGLTDNPRDSTNLIVYIGSDNRCGFHEKHTLSKDPSR